MGAGEQRGDGSVPYRLGRVLMAQGPDGLAPDVRLWLAGAGFEPSTCELRSTLLAFDRDQPDLVVLTAAPGPDEVRVACQWIRARSSVPIVVMAPRTARIDVVHLLTSGADLVLPANVGKQELVARVRALLRGRPPRRPSADGPAAYGCLRLDREHGVLDVGGTPLALEDRQLELMSLLLQNAPGVTPRVAARQLLKVDDSTLDGLVRRVRERLEAVEGWRRIIAIRRVGFRVLAERPRLVEPPTVLRLDPAVPSAGSAELPIGSDSDQSGLALA